MAHKLQVLRSFGMDKRGIDQWLQQPQNVEKHLGCCGLLSQQKLRHWLLESKANKWTDGPKGLEAMEQFTA